MSETKRPLYVELNEKRTQQGETECDVDMTCDYYELMTQKTVIAKFFNSKSPYGISDEEGKANAQYTALAVNNLHILAEALEELLKVYKGASFVLTGVKVESGDGLTDLMKKAEAALSRIS